MPVAATLALALGACVAVQVPKLPDAGLPAHWRNAPQLGAKPDLTGWWKHFHDPELNALVLRALRDSPDVAQARWRLRAARASEEAAGSQFKPSVTVNTTERSNAANTASFFQAGFDASWEIGLFGRSGANGHIARAKTGAAQAELQSARVSLVAEVVREYLELRAAQRNAALLHDVAAADAEKVRLLRTGRHLWLTSQRQVEQAVSASAMADAKLSDPDAAIAKSAQALALLLGQSEPDPAWLKPAALPRLEHADVAALPANLLRTRPDIRYAETQVVQAAGELGIATANLYPSLTIGGGLTSSSRILGHDHLGNANTIIGLAPIISIPLFDWGQVKAQRRARADLLQAALAGYRKAVLAGAAQVETSLADLSAADRRLKHVNAAVTASQSLVDMSRHYQTLGEGDRMDHIDARLALNESQLARVTARLQYGVAFVALYKALGGAPLPQHADAGAGTPTTSPVTGPAGR
ncbi:MAG TPA: efflux transporter outer membrane subunit [Rhodanobacteraceae bacterium]